MITEVKKPVIETRLEWDPSSSPSTSSPTAMASLPSDSKSAPPSEPKPPSPSAEAPPAFTAIEMESIVEVPVSQPTSQPTSSPNGINHPATSGSPPEYNHFDEPSYQATLQNFQSAMETYTDSKHSVNRKLRREMETNIESTMRQLSEMHPDPKIKQSWATKASSFAAETSKNRHIGLGHGIGMTVKGLIVICIFPVRVAGGVLVLTGIIVEGTGKFIRGTGDALLNVGKIANF